MPSLCTMLLHAVTATSISAIALQPRAAPETFYLANCASNLEGPWSEIDYYKAGHVSTGEAQDNYPDDSQKVTTSNTYVWEGGDRTVTFSSSNTAFTFNINTNAQQQQLYSIVGSAHNKYHNYNCRLDNKRALWRASGGDYGASCSSIYYCQIS